MGWHCHSTNNNPNNNVRFLGKYMIKFALIISHVHSGSSIVWAKPSGLWCSTFSCTQFGTWKQTQLYIFLHAFPLKYLSQVTLNLCGTHMNGIFCTISLLQGPLLYSIYPGYTNSMLVLPLQYTIRSLFKRQFISLILYDLIAIKSQNDITSSKEWYSLIKKCHLKYYNFIWKDMSICVDMNIGEKWFDMTVL